MIRKQLNIRVPREDIAAWKQQAVFERRSLTSLIEAAMAQYLRYQASLIRLIERGIEKGRKHAE
jgi:hypothetical protein